MTGKSESRDQRKCGNRDVPLKKTLGKRGTTTKSQERGNGVPLTLLLSCEKGKALKKMEPPEKKKDHTEKVNP